jgi:LysM repeat protein
MATFSVGQVLTAAQMNSIANLTVRAVTATSDTFVVTDADNKLITYSNTNTTTITIPPFNTVAITTGSVINVIKIGSGGTVSIIQGSGVTLASTGTVSTNPTITKQFGAVSCIKVSTDSWYVVGRVAE